MLTTLVMRVMKEKTNFKNLITSNNSSTIAVFGGSKISTKLKIVEFYLNKFNKVIFGGAMANTFLKAKNIEIGSSLYEKSMVKTAKQLIERFSEKILLPEDVITEAKTSKDIEVKPLDKILKGDNILDIGPKTINLISYILKNSKTVLWNGPAGYFENPNFAIGSKKIAKKIIELENNLFSVGSLRQLQ